jgi:hypothetical protein
MSNNFGRRTWNAPEDADVEENRTCKYASSRESQSPAFETPIFLFTDCARAVGATAAREAVSALLSAPWASILDRDEGTD